MFGQYTRDPEKVVNIQITLLVYLGGPFLRACFFLRFEDQKRVHSWSYCFASIS